MKRNIRDQIFLACTFILCLHMSVHAQTRRADKLFSRWDYAKAASLYERAAKRKSSADIYYKAGESYRMMDNYEKALYWYDKVEAVGPYSDAKFYLHYGEILRNNNLCDLAKNAFKKYTIMNPADTMGEFYIRSCNVIAEDHRWDEQITMSNLSSVNTNTADFGPYPYKDGLVFASSRSTENNDYLTYGWTGDPYLDLFYAERDSNNWSFRKPVLVAENSVNLIYHDGPASFSPDRSTIYISRSFHDLKGKKKKTLKVNRVKIYSGNMEKNKAKLVPFTYNSDSFSVAHPFVTADGKYMYFSSDMPGSYGSADLYVCQREGIDWGLPKNLGPNINTAMKEAFPMIDSAGNLYFSSNGYLGFGGLDICVAKKTAGADPTVFNHAEVLKYPFNTTANDYGIMFIKNGRSGYLSSNRQGGMGDDDLYYFDLARDHVKAELVSSHYVIGYRPFNDMEATVHVNVTFVDSRTNMPVDSGKFWRVNTKTQKYDEVNFTRGKTSFDVPEKSLIKLNVLSRFYDLYEDSLNVPNYFSDTTINLVLALRRTPVKEKIIVMKAETNKLKRGKADQALFDFNKWNIRPDARIHLDSVVMYMEEYPDAVVEISAHTDSRGTAKYNDDLSEKRAQAALNYLSSKGITMDRMHAKGFGFNRLLNKCEKGVKCTEEEHQANRRVEFWIKASF